MPLFGFLNVLKIKWYNIQYVWVYFVRTTKTKANAPVGVLFGFVFAGQLDCWYSRKFLSYRTKRFTRFYALFGRTCL